MVSAGNDCLLLKFSADITFAYVTVRTIVNLVEYLGIEDSTNLLLVSRERLKNAVFHSNHNNISDQVLFSETGNRISVLLRA